MSFHWRKINSARSSFSPYKSDMSSYCSQSRSGPFTSVKNFSIISFGTLEGFDTCLTDISSCSSSSMQFSLMPECLGLIMSSTEHSVAIHKHSRCFLAVEDAPQHKRQKQVSQASAEKECRVHWRGATVDMSQNAQAFQSWWSTSASQKWRGNTTTSQTYYGRMTTAQSWFCFNEKTRRFYF